MILPTLPAALHRPLLGAFVAIALGTGVYLLSAEWLTHQEQSKARMQTELQRTRSELDAAAKEAEHIRQIGEQLAALDIVTVETADTALRDMALRLQQHEHLFSVRLDEVSGSASAPEHDRLPVVRLRRLRLQAELLHEDALTDALQLLSSIPGGTTVPLGCEISRLQSPETAQLRVSCEFHWVSLHPRAQSQS